MVNAALTHVDPSAVIAGDAVVGPFTTVPAGVRIEAGVTLGPHVTFAPSRVPGACTVVGPGATIEGGATVVVGCRVGREAEVRAGAVVTRDVPDFAIVAGNPAEIVGYATGIPLADTTRGRRAGDAADAPGVQPTRVPGVTLHRFAAHADMRGSLIVGEHPQSPPFPVRRWFIVHDVPSSEVRGEHAHHRCHQFLISLGGEVRVMATDGTDRVDLVLDGPTQGLHLAPMTWAVQYHYSANASLLVFASDPYDPDDYIRSYDEYLALVAR